MTEKNLLNNLVSVTMFNQGQASKIFNRLQDEKQIVVLKNNVPTAVLLSPDEYDRLLSRAESGEKK
jgi:prevent-host-death family protein